MNLFEDWKVLSRVDLVYCTGCLDELMADVKNRFGEDLQSSYFKVASALHPKFKLSWLLNQNDVDEVQHLVKTVLQKYATSTELQSLTASNDDNQTKSYFWRFEKRAKEMQQDDVKGLFQIWTQWCGSSSHEIPSKLRHAFIDFNTTIPSSAAVERTFSLAKRVLSPTRTQLADDSFEMMVMLPLMHNAGI